MWAWPCMVTRQVAPNQETFSVKSSQTWIDTKIGQHRETAIKQAIKKVGDLKSYADLKL